MSKYFLIENERDVDYVWSEELVESRSKYGWTLVADLSGQEFIEVQKQGLEYARRTGKNCRLPKIFSDKERGTTLAQAYRLILGNELSHMLGILYESDPEEAVQLAKEVIKIRLGEKSSE